MAKAVPVKAPDYVERPAVFHSERIAAEGAGYWDRWIAPYWHRVRDAERLAILQAVVELPPSDGRDKVLNAIVHRMGELQCADEVVRYVRALCADPAPKWGNLLAAVLSNPELAEKCGAPAGELLSRTLAAVIRADPPPQVLQNAWGLLDFPSA